MIHEYKVTNSGFFSIKNHKILKKKSLSDIQISTKN